MDVSNLGSTDLFLRLIRRPDSRPADQHRLLNRRGVRAGGWTPVTFLLGPGHLIAGLEDVDAALTGTTLLRLDHSPDPNFPNPMSPIPVVVAQLGVDNITAAAVPESASLTLLGLGAVGLAGYARLRNARVA